jgi:hypothetical protein
MFIDDRYEVEIDDTITLFEFVSEGKNGKIPKVVRYSPTNLKDMYNLGFGDKDVLTGKVSDSIITDNGDSEKVLATVGATVYAFTANNPSAFIAIAGNSEARTRLYRIAITKYLDNISEDYNVFGLPVGGGFWQVFKPNGNYKAFLLRRKLTI